MFIGFLYVQVIIQQQAPAVVEQPSEPERYQLPYTALTLSIVFIVIFSLLLWIPGFLFTLPALAFSIAVSACIVISETVVQTYNTVATILHIHMHILTAHSYIHIPCTNTYT